jgi:hypothetical protein
MAKIGFVILGALLASVLYFAFGLLSVGRNEMARSPARKPCEWPDSLDAVASAPNNHKVVIENDRVRVLDVTVAPGEMENLHAHCRSSVMYLIYEGIYKDYGPNGELVAEATEAAPPEQFPMTLWLDPQGPHRVHNLDPKPVRLLRVELKD